MQLRPQDVLVACKLHVMGQVDWTFVSLAKELHMSPSEVHNSVGRGRLAGVLSHHRDKPTVVRPKLLSLIGISVADIFVAERGAMASGILTSTSAPCLAGAFFKKAGISMVWPCEGGKGLVSGESLQPIYESVPEACQEDSRLYRLMALLDVVRVEGPADKRTAVDLLKRAILRDDYGEQMRP